MSLDATGLTVRLTVANQGTTAMPAGLGLHPYFPEAALGPADRPPPADVAQRPGHAAGRPPYRPARRAPWICRTARWTTASTAGTAAPSWTCTTAKVRLGIDADNVFGHLVVFVPPGEDYFCVEPVSQANNAVNLARTGRDCTGLHVLQPGETLRGTIRFVA